MSDDLIELIRLMNEKPIAFNKHYVFLGCGINGAVMLSQLVYWADKSKDPNGWIYKTGKEWTEETGLTRREQDTARKNLKELGFIDEHKHGVPCKVHFKVNQHSLYSSLIELAQKNKGYAQISQTECTNPPNWIGGKRQTNTESTTKNTSNNMYSEEFENFWSEYPSCKRKGSKSDANKTFKKYEKDSSLIISVLLKFKNDDSFIKNSGEFIPSPSSWLNKKHWENDYWVDMIKGEQELIRNQNQVVENNPQVRGIKKKLFK